jgi:hypothetical protein
MPAAQPLIRTYNRPNSQVEKKLQRFFRIAGFPKTSPELDAIGADSSSSPQGRYAQSTAKRPGIGTDLAFL